jgi:hypothetical protein
MRSRIPRVGSRPLSGRRRALGLGARQDTNGGDLAVDDVPAPRGRELSRCAVTPVRVG